MPISAEAWATKGANEYFQIEEMEGEYVSAKHYNPESRYCKVCGKRLSGYNPYDECFHHPVREKPCIEYRPIDKQRLGSVHNYAEKLKIATAYGFDNLCDFAEDFYRHVGSLTALSKELGMASRTSSTYMLRKIGVEMRPAGAVSPADINRAYADYKEKMGVV